MVDRASLKATARMCMARSGHSCLKVMLLYVLAAVAAPQAALTFASSPTEVTEQLMELIYSGIDPSLALQVLQISSQQLMLQWVLRLVLQIYQFIMAFGLARYCLSCYRSEVSGPADLFVGFSMAGRIIGQQALVLLISMGAAILITIPMTIAAILASMMGELFGGIVLIAAGAAAVAAMAVIMLNYALASLALADRPELRASDSLRYSRFLIRGHRGQYFMLVLSFLGWMLLLQAPSILFTLVWFDRLPVWVSSLISIVLTLPYFLWLAPYMGIAAAGFYDTLHRENAPSMGPGSFS